MAKLKFKKSEMLQLLKDLKPESKLMLVGDHGVYMMSFDQEVGKRTIVYAVGCNPNTDEDFYDNKERLFGGDDGADQIGTAAEMAKIVLHCNNYLFVNLTATQLSVSNK